jgi:CRISPR-associated Csx2 family protein
MAKILISPLGVGRTSEKGTQPQRRYRDATYIFEGVTYPRNPFVASVIYKHLNLDGIIFIGTVKSMWEEVYYYFSDQQKKTVNNEYWLELCVQIENLDHNSPLESINLEPINELLGSHSRCVLINYGLTDQELWSNFDKLINVIKSLDVNDELYLDITHSFRSLSLFQFLSALFVNEIFPEKNIKISGVYYGMLEVQDEYQGEAPIINLGPLFEMTSWLKGMHNLNQFGNGYLISELLADSGSEQLANRVKDFSDAININYVSSISQRATDLRTALHQDLPVPLKYLAPSIEKFTSFLDRSNQSDSLTQWKVAEWYFRNKRYATSYIVLTESLITYMCEINDKSTRSQEDRDMMKDLLFHEYKDSDLSKLFRELNPIRNAIAHALLDRRVANYQNAISQLKDYLSQSKRIFATKGLDLN